MRTGLFIPCFTSYHKFKSFIVPCIQQLHSLFVLFRKGGQTGLLIFMSMLDRMAVCL